AQDWEPLLQSAILLKDKSIDFFIIGEGVMKEYVKEQINKNGLHKVHLLPYQPRELMPQLLAYADLQFIFMSKEMEAHGFPSKVYTILACSKPLLVCSGANTPIVNFLEPFGCAKLITTPVFEDKIQEIVDFLNSVIKRNLIEMGRKGYEQVQNSYSKEAVVNRYIN